MVNISHKIPIIFAKLCMGARCRNTLYALIIVVDILNVVLITKYFILKLNINYNLKNTFNSRKCAYF